MGLTMVIAGLVIITLMWIPLGLFYLGQGDGRTCGAAAGFVGIFVCIAAIMMGIDKDIINTTLFGAFGIFYLTVAYCVLAGVEDLRSLGNMSLTVALICAIACYFFLNGAAGVGFGAIKAGSLYQAFMMGCFVLLTVVVWAVTYGKVSAKLAGVLLILMAIIDLIVPAFDLLGFGKLPF